MATHRRDESRRTTAERLPAELNFDDDRSAPPRTEDGLRPRRGRLTDDISLPGEDGEPRTVDNTPTADELEWETLIDENGGGVPLLDTDAADSGLIETDEHHIGAGKGLDEAELAIAAGGGPVADDDD